MLLKNNKKVHNFIFYFFFLILFFILFISNQIYGSTSVTFFQSILLDDFGISISYDHIQDCYIFINLQTKEQLIFDNSGLCLYKYYVENLSKQIVVINGKIIIPEKLVFSLFNIFFIPIKNKQIYDFWYSEYLKNLQKEEIFNKTEEKPNQQEKEEKKEEDKKSDDKNNEKNKEQVDSSTQIQKEMEVFYSYAQAKMVDFKVISFIIIDAGHGGDDPGAVANKTFEKDINLKAALHLKKVLTTRFPYLSIYLTREKDAKLTLEDRVKISNKYLSETKTGIFISLHSNANAYSNKKSGIEVYYLDYDVIDEKIKDLVKYENKDSGTDSILNTIINRMLNEQLIFESSKLAKLCFESIKENVKEIGVSFVKGAPFYVLAYSEMPSMLIEIGYMTNPNDVKIMTSESYLDSLASAISKGVELFIKEYTLSEGFKKIQ